MKKQPRTNNANLKQYADRLKENSHWFIGRLVRSGQIESRQYRN